MTSTQRSGNARFGKGTVPGDFCQDAGGNGGSNIRFTNGLVCPE